MSLAYEGLLQHAGDAVVRRNGTQAEVCCPGHDDRRASLSIGVGLSSDPCAVIECDAGCSTEAVMAAWGLPVAALFDRWWDANGRPGIVATYDYTDEAGKLLYQVVRNDRKDFPQRRPRVDDRCGCAKCRNGRDPEWIWNLHETRRVLYQLPRVIAAVEAGGRIWIVEGEKDVHALEREGEVATCNPGGASKDGQRSKWRGEFSAFLAGADVIIVADRDEPGRAHARAVAASLKGIAASVRIVEAAVGKDAHDHLTAGRSLGEFIPLADSGDSGEPSGECSNAENGDAGARERSSLVRFSDVTATPIRWAWRDRIALGKITALAGRPKIGKGLLYSDVIAQVTRGTLEGDLQGPASAIVVTTEDDPGDTLKPRLMAAGADVSRAYVFQMGSREEPVPFRVPQDADELMRRAREVDAALVVIDPLVGFIDGKVDSHKSHPVRQAISTLNAIARETSCAVLVIFHLNKGTSTDPLLRHEGSAAFTQVVRAGMLLGADPEGDEDRRVLAVTSSNLAALAPSLVYEISGSWVSGDSGDPIKTAAMRCVGQSDASGQDLLQERRPGEDGERSALQEAIDFLRAELASGPKLSSSVTNTAKTLGIAPRTLKRARQRLGITASPRSFGGPWEWSLQSGPRPDGPDCKSADGPDCGSPVFTGDSEYRASSLDHSIDDGPDWTSGGPDWASDGPPCSIHRGREWRLADGGPWTCGACHPPADGLEIEWRRGE